MSLEVPAEAGRAETDTIWTILVAAGTGTRFGGSVPKQFVEVAGRRIVDWSLDTACRAGHGAVVVLPPGGEYHVAERGGCDRPVIRVDGGKTRSESVRRGLAAVPDDADIVLVHDAARPLASADLFARVAAAIGDGADGAVPVVEVVDTIQLQDGSPVDRATLRAVQTPQGFRLAALQHAHAGGNDATDDATLVRAAGGTVVTVDGERWNLKVTTPSDELVVAALLEARHVEAT